jgi:hypothetical protein
MGALEPAGVQAPVPHRPPKKAVAKMSFLKKRKSEKKKKDLDTLFYIKIF